MNTIVITHGEYFLSIIALCLLFAPVVHYLRYGWAPKRTEILESFTDESIKEYFSLFFPARVSTEENLRVDFTKFYDRRFGRQHFIIPGVLLFAVSGFLIFFVSRIVFEWLRETSQTELAVPPVAIAALVGAYAWALLDLVTKAYIYDLKPTNLFTTSFRLILAAPLGLAVAALLKDEAGIPIALFLGAFPARTLTTIARRQVSSRLNPEGSSNNGAIELQNLQGINRSLAERFEYEGVSTILQLAYSDPIVLTMRTHFSFSYVVDCCSQALAWLYFEDNLTRMRGFGLRGAQEISILIDEIDSAEDQPDDAKRATECRKAVVTALQLDSKAFDWALREVAGDPYTIFLNEIWCSDADDESENDS
jgi:hypothetical protein